MADTYTSREARRKAAIADALMQSALAPSQGQMVGRYYVGEGIGGGITRLGQALLGRSLSGKADTLEDESLAEQKQVKKAAYDQFNAAVTPHDVTTMEYPGSGPMFGATPKTSKYTPNNKDIAAALMKYQSDTGEEVPPKVIDMLANGGQGAVEALGILLQRDGRTYQLTKSGQPVDLGTGYDQPTRVIDLGGFYQVQPTKGDPTPIANIPKGVSPDKKFDVASAPGKAAAVAAAELDAKAKAEREQAARDADKSKGEIFGIIDEANELLAKGTGSAGGAFLSGVRVKTNMANDADAANARLKVLSGNLLGEFAKSKILGVNPTDPDRKIYEEMAGKIGDESIDPDVRVAALVQVRKMAEARAATARANIKPEPANPAAGWSYIGAKP